MHACVLADRREHRQRPISTDVRVHTQEERDALLLRSQPMRKYLMDNVLPTLTRGLQEVMQILSVFACLSVCLSVGRSLSPSLSARALSCIHTLSMHAYIQVAKVRPDDPVDYLAEFLFNADPQLS